jgi:hypothetical protein
MNSRNFETSSLYTGYLKIENMSRREPLTKLRERDPGFELSGFEQTMIFQKEDLGYVRFMIEQ